MDDRFARWLAALERRLLADLTFSEVRRALQALSSAYVQRRRRFGDGAPLDARGKRAAYALSQLAVPESITPLIQRLEKEDEIARKRIAAALEIITHQKFGTSIERNAVHGSDAPETAAFETAHFFSGCERVSYARA